MRKVPSLVDLCVQLAVDNVRYLGDVGETDSHLLARILPHCTVDQLMHIENSTEGRDLSPVTDKLWMKFYKSQFGVDSTNIVVERMRQRKVTFKWRQLYEAKVIEREDAMKKSLERLKQRYEEEDAKKRSRQIQVCEKLPPRASKKRGFWRGDDDDDICNTKSSLMKKSKRDFINSREVKNIAAMKNMARRNHSFSSTGKQFTSGFGASSSKRRF